MRFIVVTRDYAGLGFATRLGDEGHEVILATNPSAEDERDPARIEAFDRVGVGMVEKTRLAELFPRRDDYKDSYWIWDSNHSVDENETLRNEEFKVLGGGGYADKMEHDRQGCLEHVAVYGLLAPPSDRFENTADAIEFCKKNSRTAYVYKPDEGDNFDTFLPESDDPIDANEELRMHLASIEPKCAFILQERKEGVETNVEVWSAAIRCSHS
jgi:hypothetical protein